MNVSVQYVYLFGAARLLDMKAKTSTDFTPPLRMSALGQKRTLERASGMSALPPRADITQPVGPTNVLSSSAVPMDVVFELLDNELLITDYVLHQVANRNYASQVSMFEHREMSHHLCGHLSHAFLN